MVQSTADRATDRQIGLVIRAELAERKRSQAWLARAIGMNAYAMSRRCRGETHWRSAELNDVAEVLDVPVEQLLREGTADRATDRQIGLVIRAELAERKRSQAWLARAIGMNAYAMSRRCRGETHWRSAELNDVAEVLDVPVEQLLREG